MYGEKQVSVLSLKDLKWENRCSHPKHDPYHQQCSTRHQVASIFVFGLYPLTLITSHSLTALKCMTKVTMVTVSITKGGPDQVNKGWDSPQDDWVT